MAYLAPLLTRLGARIESREGSQQLVIPADIRARIVAVRDASAELHPDGTWTEVLPALRAVPPERASAPLPKSRRNSSPGLQPDLGPLLDCIRARGWRVAACNDYDLDGEIVTAWLFSKNGQYVRADGRSDLDVLDHVLSQIREREGDPK